MRLHIRDVSEPSQGIRLGVDARRKLIERENDVVGAQPAAPDPAGAGRERGSPAPSPSVPQPGDAVTPTTPHSRWLDPEPERGRDRFHVAINMDGNGRWALMRGQPRESGHVAGAAAVRRTVECAAAYGITTLTLYAFSSDNWRRPPGEVNNLMSLFQQFLESECARLRDRGVRFSVIGRRDRISACLKRSIEQVQESTSAGASLHLRIAIDYSARDALLAAAGRVARGFPLTRQAFEQSLCEAMHAPSGTRDVDLLIRTGGEQRLSDFMLWESAYAELYFTNVLWPDFSEADLASAVRAFAARDRRYGGIQRTAP